MRPAAPATVVRFDVPFTHLMGFFIKAVFAAIPALILLGVLLWFAGSLLKTLLPGARPHRDPDPRPAVSKPALGPSRGLLQASDSMAPTS